MSSSIVIAKTPKGTRDMLPEQMIIRQRVIETIRNIFTLHNAQEIDTPIFELRNVLTEKYGEESKLIYNLEDQGGEILSLRYDLTVPFARFIATHGITQIKRFQIGKVYRRDQPAIERGRFREFYQCDFDIAGSNSILADVEVITVMNDILSAIQTLTNNAFDYVIKIGSRKVLNHIVTVLSSIPNDKFKTVCSSIDKLDKLPQLSIKQELADKGISQESIEKLFELLNADSLELIKTFTPDISNDILTLVDYLRFSNVTKFEISASLARGLDYYTGIIFEAVAIGSDSNNNKMGSIAGGGRYDNLIGMFSRKQIPAVGLSIGVERIFALMEQQQQRENQIIQPSLDVYICSIGNFDKEKMEISNMLIHNNVSCEYSYKNKKLIEQFGVANSKRAKITILLAPDEIKQNKIKIKTMNDKCELLIDKTDLIDTIKTLI